MGREENRVTGSHKELVDGCDIMECLLGNFHQSAANIRVTPYDRHGVCVMSGWMLQLESAGRLRQCNTFTQQMATCAVRVGPQSVKQTEDLMMNAEHHSYSEASITLSFSVWLITFG